MSQKVLAFFKNLQGLFYLKNSQPFSKTYVNIDFLSVLQKGKNKLLLWLTNSKFCHIIGFIFVNILQSN